MILLLPSCSSSFPDEMPDLGVNGSGLELNTHIRISTPKDCNSFVSGKRVCLEITNLSEKVWGFHIKKDILIYRYSDKQWEKVSDKGIIIGKTDVTLSPSGESPSDREIVSILPKVERDQSVFLRIFIIVHEQAPEKEDYRKGAFVDVRLGR
jgi:hypothetical protein